MSSDTNPARVVILRLTPENCPTRAAEISTLLNQLRGSATRLAADDVRATVANDSVHVYVVEIDGEAAGTLTLVLTPLLNGLRARIEDVVVHGRFRRRGVAAALVKHALEVARTSGALTVDLTSSPERTAANALYQSLGFERRETNVYCFDCRA